MNQVDQIRIQLQALNDALLSNNTGMTNILRDVHKQLKEMPECVTLLSEEEIQIIIRSAEKYSGLHLASQTAKSSQSQSVTKRLKSLNLDEDI